MFLRQSTASQEIILGTFLDDTDGKTPETGLTIANTDIKLFKAGQTTETDKNSGGATHISGGRYSAVLDATDTDTVGVLEINVAVAGALPVRREYTILEEAVFDRLFATDAGGYQVPIWSSASATVNLSGTTISTSQQVASVTGNVGGISGVTFPANFSLLMISGSGAIGLVDELGPQALSANSLEADIASQVWNTLTTGSFTDESFGDRILISANNTRTLAITGAGHIASVLHDAEPNSIPEDAFLSGAISARVIATDAIDADALADGAITSGVFAAYSITATALATSAGEEIADKVWDEAIAAHLASGSTGEALNNAGGSGNPWITDLSTGYTGTQAGNILNQVKSKTDLITTGTIQSSIPVTAQGQITGPLFIGDDYLSANGRAFQWTVALPSGFVIATSTCRFGMEHAEGATEGASFAVDGTVTDAGGGNVTLSFDVPKATTGTLNAGFYRWSVEIASAGGNEVTRVASDGKKLVEWREKQT